MKYEKSITVNMGAFNSMRLGCTEAESFDEIDVELRREILAMGLELPDSLVNVIQKPNKK